MPRIRNGQVELLFLSFKSLYCSVCLSRWLLRVPGGGHRRALAQLLAHARSGRDQQ